MANNIVTVSGMFGAGKTYFSGSPVVIDISGLEWPEATPFSIVRIGILRRRSNTAETELEETFTGGNVTFNTEDEGYVNGADIFWLTDNNVRTRKALVVTSRSKSGPYPGSIMRWMEQFFLKTPEEMMAIDAAGSKRIVELDSSDARCDLLLELCEQAYGTETMVQAGEVHADTGRQPSINFDIKSALRAIWSDYRFDAEVTAANAAIATNGSQQALRPMREYALHITTEYINSSGVFTTTECEDEHGNKNIPGGQCLIGRLTPWERSQITDKADADVSHLEHTGVRNGDASTKPTGSPERVGRDSLTSWVDVMEGYTRSIFYPASAVQESDDVPASQQGWGGHAPIVLRDSQPYTDFLFVNRRGAVETCSGMTKESMGISVETEQYAVVEPGFKPSRSLSAISADGRRSWAMSSGYVTREWAEWWTTEFLTASRRWMLYQGAYVPVTVEPSKKNVTIYDRSKQQMVSVDFTVTLALEG